MEIVQRIKSLIEEKYGVRGTTSFAKAIGVEQVTLSRYLNGSRGLSLDVVEAILRTFPDVNAEWLLRDNGNMFLDEEAVQVTSEPMKGSVPFYKDLPVSAGKMDILKAFVDKEEGQGWIQLPDVSAIAAFPVKGCSMEPYIMNGDFVAIAPVNRWDRVDPDKVYMIITKDDRMIKHLMVDNDDDSILWAVSPNYNKFRIHKDEVIEIYRVVFYGRMA